MHKGPQGLCGDLPALCARPAILDKVHVGILRNQQPFAAPPPQVIERRIVADAKEPGLEIVDDRCPLYGGVGLQQGFLQHVLAVDDRAGHARGITVQTRPQYSHPRLELRARISCRLCHSPDSIFSMIQTFSAPGESVRHRDIASRTPVR
ncbi:hypothetical protein GCM10010862_36860 [Devosia nitrariae]|uniref:Uncharacterized protein n=1 Tax=Devosia nitrariae TaxID=2071872 RepID=A0ABQ5W8Y2_9HYPH|nr:hypothetical protein GCM10010862_36860 [Devosia nitrariae]